MYILQYETKPINKTLFILQIWKDYIIMKLLLLFFALWQTWGKLNLKHAHIWAHSY